MFPKVYIIGMPGSGKTTFGKKLSEQLKFKFIDLDEIIVERSGKAIAEIFREKGEKTFRALEKEALESISGRSLVIATGGGTPCYFNNIDYMLNNGLVVHLEVSPETIISRMDKAEIQKRPLFQKNNLKGTLNKLKKERLPFYKKAHLTLSENIIFQEALRNVKNFLDSPRI